MARLPRRILLGLALAGLAGAASAQPRSRDAALIAASARGDAAEVRRLVAAGASVRARDASGRPVATDLAVAVVDDAVLALADDRSARILARLYLEPEMPGQQIDEPNFYFSADPKAPAALDLLLGTQGWRRFKAR